MGKSTVSAVRAKTHRYSAFGLQINSSIVLRSLPDSKRGESDVCIRCIDAPQPEWTDGVREQEHTLEREGLEARFWFRNVGSFLVRDGRTVVVIPERNGVDHALLPLYVEGMIMAMVLYQRGLTVLHASVIEINGGAVACMGPIGVGKSSIAAAFYSRGYRILTDDNAAIRLTSGIPAVMPGYPYVKLFPTIAASLGFEASNLASLHSTRSKMAGTVTNRFSDGPLPLRTIYVLGREPGTITRVSPLPATMHLIRNAVPTRWGHCGDAHQLQQCGAIVNQVPVFTVPTFRDLTDIPTLLDALENHQSTLAVPTAGPASALVLASPA